MKKSFLLLTSVIVLLTACGDSSSKQDAPAAPEATVEAVNPADETIAEPAYITISAGDDMKYDLTEITVKEGQTVNLTLKHTGTLAKTAMGHNFVLLANGVDLAAFANAAVNAADNDYIPKTMDKDVIAHTQTIGGGETTEIEFQAPEKGTYDFLCSFPGHFAMMKGKFIVE